MIILTVICVAVVLGLVTGILYGFGRDNGVFVTRILHSFGNDNSKSRMNCSCVDMGLVARMLYSITYVKHIYVLVWIL